MKIHEIRDLGHQCNPILEAFPQRIYPQGQIYVRAIEGGPESRDRSPSRHRIEFERDEITSGDVAQESARSMNGGRPMSTHAFPTGLEAESLLHRIRPATAAHTRHPPVNICAYRR